MEKRIALVTGAAKGIGKAITQRLVEEDYFVIATDIDVGGGKKLLKDFGKEKLQFAKADICKEKIVQKLFGKISREYKQLDVLVNNAGIIHDNVIWKMALEDFETVLNVNLKGTWLMCREAARMMKEQAHV